MSPINIETLRKITNKHGTIIQILADGDSKDSGIWEQSGNVFSEKDVKAWRSSGRKVIDGPAVFSDKEELQLGHASATRIGSFIVNEEFRRCWISPKGEKK